METSIKNSKIMKHSVVFLLASLCSIGVFAQDFKWPVGDSKDYYYLWYNILDDIDIWGDSDSVNVEVTDREPNSSALGVGSYYKDTIIIPETVKDPKTKKEYTVTSIKSATFRYSNTVVSITIPKTVETIGASAFSVARYDKGADYNLTEIICKATTPPEANDGLFHMMSDTDTRITLYVPAGSLDAYKTTAPWSEFKNIIELPAEPTGIDQVENNVTLHTSHNTIYCNVENFKIYSVQGQNVTNKNGNLSRGLYIVATEAGSKKVLVE